MGSYLMRALRFQDNPDHFGGANVNAKRPTVVVRSGYTGVVECQLRDAAGLVINLLDYDIPLPESEGVPIGDQETQSSQYLPINYMPLGPALDAGDVRLVGRLFERAIGGCSTAVDITVLDVETGRISFELPADITAVGGLWLIEFGVVDANNARFFLSDAYVHLERSLDRSGPPAIAELRLMLRDYGQENELLDAVDFDASEISFAAGMCVDEWNESDPFDGPQYNSQNFPFRQKWIIGMLAYLYMMASEHYLRNTLPYQAGGLQHDDKNKAAQYMQKAQLARQEWQKFVAERKTVLAVQGAFGEVPGVYQGYGGRW